ncbi:MAG: protein kinase, partial [Candidatus Aminicenantes bacterium]|nr:protein kinase [Candidatus Aminicenantes bacterium]
MIGQTVSHYKILKKIGQGGMSTVYLADDTKLSRKVALKFLPKELITDRVANERFKREARATALLNNPNIITIHEINEYQGRSYIVMEYVEGSSLKEKIEQYRETPYDLKKIRDIVVMAIQICRGLEKAHQTNIIHRDIKPGNILIDDNGQAIITDFGLAKLTDLSKLTRNTSTLGTVHYMSPENIEGEEVDCRTDIWSFGVVFYEMITGEVPFKENYLQALFYSIMNEEPTPISNWCDRIPVQLEKIVNRCLEKNASQRYPTISEVLSDMKNLKQNLDSGEYAIKSKKIRWIRKLYRKIGKRAVPLVIAAALILFILIPNPGGKAIKRWLFSGTLPDKKYLAVLPFTSPGNNPENQSYCLGTTEMINAKLSLLEPFQKKFWVLPGSRLPKQKDNFIKKLRQDYGITLALSGSIQLNQDNVIHTLNLIEAKTRKKLKTKVLRNHITNLSGLQDGIVLELLKMIDIKITPEIHRSLTTGGTSLPGAYEFYLKGLGLLQDKNNQENIDEASALFTKAINQDDSYVEAHAALAKALFYKYQLTKESIWIDRAVSQCNRALKINNRLPDALLTLGNVYKETKQYDKAIQKYKKALEINPNCFIAYLELADSYERVKTLTKAEETYKKAIRIRPGYCKAYEFLGFFYTYQGRNKEAEKMYLKIAELTPDNVLPYEALIGIYVRTGDAERARPAFEKAIQLNPTATTYSN